MIILGMCAVALLLVNCQRVTSHALNFPAYFGTFERHNDISYGSAARERLDVYSPRHAKNLPVIVFWHGGMWIEGSRVDYRFVGAALARAGYVAVLPDYRLYPDAKFPAFVEDGAAAVRWVHDHIADYGGDAGAIFLMGHSAGAHIAAMIALDARYLSAREGSPQWIRGLIGLSGPYAIDTRRSPSAVGMCEARVACTRLLEEVFSSPYTWEDWQPAANESVAPPPTLLIHGSHDAFVSVRHSETLRDRLTARGGHVEWRVYEGADHSDTILSFSFLAGLSPPALDEIHRFVDMQMHADVVLLGTTPL